MCANLEAATEELQRSDSEHTQLMQEYGRVYGQAGELARQLEACEAERSSLSVAKLELVEQLRSAERALGALRADVSARDEEIHGEVQRRASKEAQLHEALRARDEQLDACKSRMDELQRQVEAERAGAAELLSELQALNDESDGYSRAMGQMEQQLVDAHRQIDLADEAARRASSSKSESDEIGEARVTVVASKLEAATQRAEALEAENGQLRDALDAALGRCTGCMVGQRMAEEEVEALKLELDGLRAHAVG